MEPENTTLEKEKTSTNHQFLGSMLVFGGVCILLVCINGTRSTMVFPVFPTLPPPYKEVPKSSLRKTGVRKKPQTLMNFPMGLLEQKHSTRYPSTCQRPKPGIVNKCQHPFAPQKTPWNLKIHTPWKKEHHIWTKASCSFKFQRC